MFVSDDADKRRMVGKGCGGMKLYLLEPEVAGGHGEHTEYRSEKDGHISEKVVRLHYEFFGWLGDDILESHPSFIVTDRLAKALIASDIDRNSMHFSDCMTSKSEFLKESQPDMVLPKFKKFAVGGRVETDGSTFWGWSGLPFSVTSKAELVVTENALAFLKSFNIAHCAVKELTLLETPMLPIIRMPVDWTTIEQQIGVTINRNYKEFYETLGAVNLDDYFYIVGIDPVDGLASHIEWVRDCYEDIDFPTGLPPTLIEWLPVGNTDDIFIFCNDDSVILVDFDFEFDEIEVHDCSLLDFVKRIVNNQTESKLIHNDLGGIPHSLQIYEKRRS